MAQVPETAAIVSYGTTLSWLAYLSREGNSRGNFSPIKQESRSAATLSLPPCDMNSVAIPRLWTSRSIAHTSPILDFLVPALAYPPKSRRYVSTTSSTTDPSPSPQQDGPPKRRKPLSLEQRTFLDSAVSSSTYSQFPTI